MSLLVRVCRGRVPSVAHVGPDLEKGRRVEQMQRVSPATRDSGLAS